MVNFTSLSLLALAGSAIAAPAPYDRNQHRGKKVEWHTVVKTVYHTVYPGWSPKSSSTSVKAPVAAPTTTVVTSAPAAPPAPTSSSIVLEQARPRPSSSKVSSAAPVRSSSAAPVKSSSAAPVKASSTSKAPAYTPAPTPTPTPVVTVPTDNTGYMATVDEWRGKLGLKALKYDSNLEQNALKTARDGNGKMVHWLGPGTFGQVLAPGDAGDFYHCFVGGWLCELPNMAGMNGVCAEASQGWYYTSTGHAEILTDAKYSKIGCGNVGGIWACDVA